MSYSSCSGKQNDFLNNVLLPHTIRSGDKHMTQDWTLLLCKKQKRESNSMILKRESISDMQTILLFTSVGPIHLCCVTLRVKQILGHQINSSKELVLQLS